MRYLAQPIEQTLAERKMAFVAGPRQVGKTTLARSLLESQENYFTWDLDRDRRAIVRADGAFWQTSNGVARVVLDEVHKYPRFKRLLKGLYDTEGHRTEIIVTGSGRLDIYQRGGDSLFGRYQLHRLHPFTIGEYLADGKQTVITPDELSKAVDSLPAANGSSEALELIDRFSGFPEPLFAARLDRLRRWRRARRELVLREDLRDLTRIRDIGLVDHLVELLPERVGSPLSVNALREVLGVAFDTARSWLETLGRLFFLFELRPFTGKLARTLRREAKVYLFDPTAIESEGARFENVVALHLLKLVDAWNDLGHGDFELRYVRDKERREVDFVITQGRRAFMLIETKLAGERPSPSLRYFRERLGAPLAIQLVRDGRVKRSSDAVLLPAARFLALI